MLEKDNYKVLLKSPARKGKANQELIKTLSKHFSKRAEVIKGLKNKKKVVRLHGVI